MHSSDGFAARAQLPGDSQQDGLPKDARIEIQFSIEKFHRAQVRKSEVPPLSADFCDCSFSPFAKLASPTMQRTESKDDYEKSGELEHAALPVVSGEKPLKRQYVQFRPCFAVRNGRALADTAAHLSLGSSRDTVRFRLSTRLVPAIFETDRLLPRFPLQSR